MHSHNDVLCCKTVDCTQGNMIVCCEIFYFLKIDLEYVETIYVSCVYLCRACKYLLGAYITFNISG